MRITALGSAPGQPPIDPRGSHLLTTRVEVGPQRVYRRTLALRLATAGVAPGDRLVLDAAASILQGAFQPLDYDALRVADVGLAADTAQVTNGEGGRVRVVLDAPRELREVRLTSGSADEDYWLEAYRLDGETPSEKPTVSAQNRSFQRREAELLQGGVRAFAGGGVMHRLEAGGQDALLRVGGQQGSKGNPLTELMALKNDDFELQFRDARMELRLTDSSRAGTPLRRTSLRNLWLRSYPTGPRIGLAAPNQEPLFFWRANGEIGQPDGAPLADGQVDAGALLATELGHLLERLPVPLPAEVTFTLVLESDAPCRFQFTAFELELRAQRLEFPDGLPKRVLRFPSAGHTEALDIPLPAGARVRSALLRTAESFGEERSLTALGEGRSVTGVSLAAGRGQAAQAITPPKALLVSGAAVALLPLTRQVTLQAELQADLSGRPAGSTLAKGSATLTAPGVPAWLTLSFEGQPRPALSHAPHWLLLSATAGEALWLSAEEAAPGSLVVRSAPQGPWENVVAALGCALLSETAAPTMPPVALSLDGAPVPANSSRLEPNGSRSYHFPDGFPASPGGLVQLSFEAATSGTLTVYPPVVEYDFSA